MIKVIDKICGWGKTHWMFSEMRSRKSEKWIYVSPYLSEVGDGNTKGRIQKELPELHFKSPAKVDFGGKGRSFKKHVQDGDNIAVTHQLYKGLDKATLQLLNDEKYNVVIDETLDLISLYSIDDDDKNMLLNSGLVKEDSEFKGKLVWNYQNDYKGFFKDLKRMCEMEMLYIYRTKDQNISFFVNKIPPRLLECDGDVYVLTYRFKGSLMHSWLNINQIAWDYFEPITDRCDKEIKDRVRELIEIVKPPRSIYGLQTNSYTGSRLETAFSKGWFNRAEDSDFEIISTAMDSVIKHKFKGFSGDMMYTTFKDYAEDVRGERMRKALVAFGLEEGTTTPIDSFVSKNMRASNEYSEVTKIIHVCNTYPHLILKNYILHLGENVISEEYALSELVQFIFRSAIRNGQPIKLCIFSNRMRELLERWLKEER